MAFVNSLAGIIHRFATWRRSPRPTSGMAWPLHAEWLEVRCLLSYAITDLGTLGGTGSNGYALSDFAQVVGPSLTQDNQGTHAFLWTNGMMTDLGTLDGAHSIARSINNAGSVVGDSGHAFLWVDGTMIDLGTLGGPSSAAFGINNKDQVVGESESSGDRFVHPFLWQDGAMIDLGTLGDQSYANDINDEGQVVGISQIGNLSHATLWADGQITDLGTLGGSNSYVYRINNAGQAVGQSQIPGDSASHATIWDNGQAIDLGTLGGMNSIAMGINDRSQVVGVSTIVGTDWHPFLYSHGVMTDLNDLLPAGSGWVLDVASGINNLGQITGSGTINGQTHAFLMTPNYVTPDFVQVVGLSPMTNEVARMESVRFSSERQADPAAAQRVPGVLFGQMLQPSAGTIRQPMPTGRHAKDIPFAAPTEVEDGAGLLTLTPLCAGL